MKIVGITGLSLTLELSPIDCLGLAELCRLASPHTNNNTGEALAGVTATMLELGAYCAWRLDDANEADTYSLEALRAGWSPGPLKSTISSE